MKKIMIALALAGFIYSGAEAQTTKTQTKSGQECKVVKKKITNKKYTRSKPATATNLASKYQVCREEGGYYVCCVYSNSSTARSLK